MTKCCGPCCACVRGTTPTRRLPLCRATQTLGLAALPEMVRPYHRLFCDGRQAVQDCIAALEFSKPSARRLPSRRNATQRGSIVLSISSQSVELYTFAD